MTPIKGTSELCPQTTQTTQKKIKKICVILRVLRANFRGSIVFQFQNAQEETRETACTARVVKVTAGITSRRLAA